MQRTRVRGSSSKFDTTISTGTVVNSSGTIVDRSEMENPYKDFGPKFEITRDETHKGPPYTKGGNFESIKIESDLGVPCVHSFVTTRGTTSYQYNNIGFVPNPYVLSIFKRHFPAFAYDANEYKKARLDPNYKFSGGPIPAMGAEGWKKFQPGKPGLNLAQSLAELKDFPKMIRQTRDAVKSFADLWKSMRRTRSARDLAGDWLNAQFGWLPVVSDVMDLYKTHRTMDARINRLIKYNGQWERRGGLLRDDHKSYSISDPKYTYHYINWSGTVHPGWGSALIQLDISDKIWFRGKFRYWIPELGKSEWVKKDYIKRQYGLSLNPSLLYELTPWSWLLDWFTNAGDVVYNMSPYVDNLVAQYAYVMRHVNMKARIISVDGPMSNRYSDVKPDSVSDTWNWSYDHKSRLSASPFGFGITWKELTPRQLSILGALGISRLA